jgi:hypothetical protein
MQPLETDGGLNHGVFDIVESISDEKQPTLTNRSLEERLVHAYSLDPPDVAPETP